jgi:hypothetical protein
MGEDSWVVLRHIKYARALEVMRLLEDEDLTDLEQEEIMGAVVTEAVVAWNWVDEDGEPLKTPREGLELGDLYTHEIQFLVDQILASAEARKN